MLQVYNSPIITHKKTHITICLNLRNVFRRKKFQTYEDCLKNPHDYTVIRPVDIGLYLRSPFAWWASKHGAPKDKDKPPYMEELFKRGLEHEVKYEQTQLGDIITLKAKPPREAFKECMDLLRAHKTDIIRECPLYWYPDGLVGRADVIYRVRRSALASSSHYAIKEIKSSKKIQPYHVLQAACYTYMLGQIQNYQPDEFIIVDGNLQEHTYNSKKYILQFFQILEKMRKLAEHDCRRPRPHYNVQAWPYAEYENKMALECQDVSTVMGIGPNTTEKLKRAGIRKLVDLVNCRSNLVNEKIRCQATSQMTGKPIQKNTKKIHMPDAYLDIESMGSHTDVFMIGILEHKKPEKYTALFAYTESDLTDKYMQYRYDNPQIKRIYHWSSYDASNMRRMGCDTSGFEDALVLVKDRYLFPIPSYSLKIISEYCGYAKYGDTDLTGMMCGYYWRQYKESGEKGYRDELEKYNKMDCEAIRCVLEWVEQKKVLT